MQIDAGCVRSDSYHLGHCPFAPTPIGPLGLSLFRHFGPSLRHLGPRAPWKRFHFQGTLVPSASFSYYFGPYHIGLNYSIIYIFFLVQIA